MFRPKNQKELNDAVWVGFAFIEEDQCYAVRLSNGINNWVSIPRDVLSPEKEPNMNSDELIGKLFRKGYFAEVNILIEQLRTNDIYK